MKNTDETKKLLIKFYKYLQNKKIIAKPYRGRLNFEVYPEKFIKSLALDKQRPLAKNKQTQEVCEWVNVYEDENGRFLSDESYDDYNEAYHSRDDVITYVDTVKIVSEHGLANRADATSR